MKKILQKIKDLWSDAKEWVYDLYKAAEKWVGVFILEYKAEFIALAVALLALVVDIFAGTRFNSFFAPALIGFLGYSVVARKKQADKIKELEEKIKALTPKSQPKKRRA